MDAHARALGVPELRCRFAEAAATAAESVSRNAAYKRVTVASSSEPAIAKGDNFATWRISSE